MSNDQTSMQHEQQPEQSGQNSQTVKSPDLNDKAVRDALRAAGCQPPSGWLDVFLLGVPRDCELLFKVSGVPNTIVGIENLAIKGTLAAFGGYRLYKYLRG